MRCSVFARAIGIASLAVVLLSSWLPGQEVYVPRRGDDWERAEPAPVGMDPAALDAAIAFAKEHESDGPRDLEEGHYLGFGREPHGEAVGPFRGRGPLTGIVIRHGYIVAEWGDPRRVDMTFSVTKSFLSTVLGLAWDEGLIDDLDDPVSEYSAPVDLPEGDGEAGIDRAGYGAEDPVTLFESEHNRRITWDHLLRQTSDWAGTLWGKPDWADRPGRDIAANKDRDRNTPGTRWKYNDVRVNLLALAALQVWRRPLPVVLRERVMDPIGASNTWRWYGYDNSWITLDGLRMQSVSGGGHWGGGMFLSARDQARFGLLTLRKGRWGEEQILSSEWFELARTPTPAQPDYGFMNYFLNYPNEDGRRRFPSAPPEAYAHLGFGSNVVYVDPVNDLVVVVRWIESGAVDGFLSRLLASID